MWRTIASDALQAPAMAKLIKERGFTKIALLSVASAYGEPQPEVTSATATAWAQALAGEHPATRTVH